MIQKSVMKLDEGKDYLMYRHACNCKSPDCDLTIEVEKDNKTNFVFFNFYKNLYWSAYWGHDSSWLSNMWSRIKCACRVIFVGFIKMEECHVMEIDEIDGLIDALKEAKDHMKNGES